MTRLELFCHLETLFPSSLSCEWDHDGAMLCLNWQQQVKKAVTCLDVTTDVVSCAVREGADLIISHHPFLFFPLSRVDERDLKGELLGKLIASGIAVFSFHTRLDGAKGGLNDRLASLLGMEHIREVECGEPSSLARMGELPPCTPKELAQRVAKTLSCSVRLFEGKKQVNRVMSVCGGGKDFLPLALREGADAFVSGDLSYNAVLDAVEAGLTVVDASHRGTELPVCELLAEILLDFSPGIQVVPCTLGGEEQWILP